MIFYIYPLITDMKKNSANFMSTTVFTIPKHPCLCLSKMNIEKKFPKIYNIYIFSFKERGNLYE